ncbi:MAG: minor capsid protein [Clostridiales bacterium]|jgi:hypothetical protein|nr:minor capsid protein [Clostridiales bacterium]
MGLEIELNLDGIRNVIDKAIDGSFMYEAYDLLARMSAPYVPASAHNPSVPGSGHEILTHSYRPTPEYLEYNTPYAHYQYEGKVIDMHTGEYTGAELQYSKATHPFATSKWDKAMLKNVTLNKKFCNNLAIKLRRRLKNGG